MNDGDAENPPAWGVFPAGQVSDVTPADMRAAAEYFAAAEVTAGPMPALAATLAADRATMRAREAARVRGVFGAPMTAQEQLTRP